MRWIIGLLLPFLALPAVADEYYEFFSVHCAPPVLFASIESVGMWNVGSYVWPAQRSLSRPLKSWLAEGWRRHEENLQALEEKHSLYVFGQAYGRYAAEPIVCENPEYRLQISADPVERRYVNDDDIVVRYRGPMKVKIEMKEGKVAFEGIMRQGDSLHVDRDEFEICKDSNGEREEREITCMRKPLRPF